MPNDKPNLLNRLTDFLFGKNKTTILFDKLKADPGNKELARQVKEQFAKQPVEVVIEIMRRVKIGKKNTADTTASLFEKFRKTWINTIKKQQVQPLQYIKPITKQQLIDTVKLAEKDGLLVRAVGTGHSFSDVSNATDILVDMLTLNNTLPLENDTFKANMPALFNCEAGMLVQKLNAELDAIGLALPTMAAFDMETIYGAIATSTHGTGIRVQGMSAMVRSMDLIAAGGKCYRLERTNGITDAAKFKAKYPDNTKMELIQDDDKFFSAVVGFGLMGIVYSLVIEPVKTFYLKQKLWVTNWDKVKPKLQDRKFFIEIDPQGNTIPKDPVTNEFPPTRAQVFVNPYITQNFLTKTEGHTCVVQVQTAITKEEYEKLKQTDSTQKESKFVDFIQSLTSNGEAGLHEALAGGEDRSTLVQEISTEALLDLLNQFPLLTPLFLDVSMLALLTGSGKFGKSFAVMNQGKLAIKNAGYSVEPGFAVDANNSFIKGTEEIIRVAALSEQSVSYLTAPVCLRFVKKSEEYMSPEYNTDTCMIDVPMILGTVGDDQMMDRMQLDLIALGARPHWGKICNLVNGKELMQEMYPKFKEFKKTVDFFNPKGTFNSSFSYRSGISDMEYNRV
jgi:L-gulono-1,4-lactone dehydrogenase